MTRPRLSDEELGILSGDRLREKLRSDDDCRKYVDSQGVPFEQPRSSGFSYVPILQHLWGMPLCNAVLAFVAGFHPSYLRIVFGEETTDGICDRVTIHAFEDDKEVIRVRDIHQEIQVGYSCGYDVNQVTCEIRDGLAPGSLSDGLERMSVMDEKAVRRAEL